MRVQPLDWSSWWEARLRMREVWRPWADLYHQANEAMANALRSGQVHYRGDALAHDGFTPLPVKDVISTLRKLSVAPDEAAAEYEIAEIMTTTFGSDSLRVSRPHTWTSRRFARILRPELVWPEFRDYLIRFELPANPTPDRKRYGTRSRRAPDDGQPSGRHMQPIWRNIHSQIDKWLDDDGCPVHGDGRQAALERRVAELLQEREHEAGEATIRRHVRRRINRYIATKKTRGS
jgi:hypothetical protein